MSHRLFVAIRPPAPVRDALLDAMHGVEGARWQDDDQLHLTLRYVGEVDLHIANDLAGALDSLRFDPFDLAVRGTGIFERRGRAHTLWAGIEQSRELATLQARVERTCQAVGLAAEGRKFAPHVTLARLNTASGTVAPFLARTGDALFGAISVDNFWLYESHLRAEGSLYERVRRYSAGGRS